MKRWIALFVCSATAAMAQLAPPSAASTTTAKSLDDLRATYTAALKRAHYPVLQQYLLDLQGRRSTALLAAEQQALSAEILRVQGMIAGAGVFEPLQKTAPSAPSTAGRSITGILLTLSPSEALPRPDNATAAEARVPLGSASWKCSRIPAGSYDLVARYECASVPTGGKIEVTVGDKTYERQIKVGQVTSGKPRILRVISFTLDTDLIDTRIKISAHPDTPWLQLKEAYLATPLPSK